MLYIAYFFITNGQNIKIFSQNFPFFDLQRVENCLRSSCTHQRPLDHLQTTILKLLGGPWLRLHGPSGHYAGPHGHSSTRIVTK